MIKNIFFLFILIIFSNCSLDTKTNIWKETNEENKNNQLKEIFKKSNFELKELNTNIKINLKDKFSKNSFENNLRNNLGYLNYDGSLKKIKSIKFDKVKNFKFVDKEIHFTQGNKIIFSEKRGSIIKVDEDLKKIWKVNHYTKNEKKTHPNLFFASNSNYLIVADSISNYYKINLINGDLVWKKNNTAPFNSQIKIYKDKFFVVDLENILRCYSIETGEEIWSFKSESSYINSQNKLSMVIDVNKVVFINSLGDITALRLNNGRLLWQTPTQLTAIKEDSFTLKNSELVLSKKNIYFSNNKNELFSINLNNGRINWKQLVNSGLKPSLIGNLLFIFSRNGFFVIIDTNNGNIIRVTQILIDNKSFEKLKISPISFLIGKKNVYLNLNNGKIIRIKILDGKFLDLSKIDSKVISQSYMFNQNLFLLKENSLIKLD